MKYCEEYVAALSAFVDGELSEAESGLLRAHLASCPGCRAYLADLRAMQAAFPPMETAPVDFAAGVMARIQGGTVKPRSRRRLYPLLGAVAACLVLLVTVGLFPAPPAAPSAAPPQATQEAPRMRDTANEFAIADSDSAPALVDSAPAPADTAPESAAAPADAAPVDSAPAPVTAPGNPGETAVGI
ncbi:MAG: zf-HC2 domain-containing protein, partial [Oscillospiraceae bacterium]